MSYKGKMANEGIHADTLLHLIGRTASRDQAAFRELFELTSPKLLGVAIQVLRERAAAEDALQDAFVQIWQRASEYQASRGSVMAWLATIVRYRAIDQVRKQKVTYALGQGESAEQIEVPDMSTQPDLIANALEDNAHLRECLQRLSESQRRSVLLAFFEGLTHEELAARVAEPIGTIKSRIRRGLLRLRECLAEHMA